jgi:hypothetical protein
MIATQQAFQYEIYSAETFSFRFDIDLVKVRPTGALTAVAGALAI